MRLCIAHSRPGAHSLQPVAEILKKSKQIRNLNLFGARHDGPALGTCSPLDMMRAY